MEQADHKKLEVKFHQAMLGIYEAALKEAKYPATRFRQMVLERGGLATAFYLLDSKPEAVSEGFVELALRKRLDLTVESLVQEDQWRPLFSETQLKTAKHRLREYPSK